MVETKLSPEQVKAIVVAEQSISLEPDAPIVEAHRWMYLGGILLMEEVRNHPRLGNKVCLPHEIIRTSRVLYFNPECRIATTQNTVYVLFEEA